MSTDTVVLAACSGRNAVERSYCGRDILTHARERTAVRGGERVVARLQRRLAHGRAPGCRLAVLGPAHDPDRVRASRPRPAPIRSSALRSPRGSRRPRSATAGTATRAVCRAMATRFSATTREMLFCKGDAQRLYSSIVTWFGPVLTTNLGQIDDGGNRHRARRPRRGSSFRIRRRDGASPSGSTCRNATAGSSIPRRRRRGRTAATMAAMRRIMASPLVCPG